MCQYLLPACSLIWMFPCWIFTPGFSYINEAHICEQARVMHLLYIVLLMWLYLSLTSHWISGAWRASLFLLLWIEGDVFFLEHSKYRFTTSVRTFSATTAQRTFQKNKTVLLLYWTICDMWVELDESLYRSNVYYFLSALLSAYSDDEHNYSMMFTLWGKNSVTLWCAIDWKTPTCCQL